MTFFYSSVNDGNSSASCFLCKKNHHDTSRHEAKHNPGTKIEYLRVLDRKFLAGFWGATKPRM
jgi:hypothetical protein